MTPTLDTRRMLLRPLELADTEQIKILFPHCEIVGYAQSSTFPIVDKERTWKIFEAVAPIAKAHACSPASVVSESDQHSGQLSR